MGFLLAALAIAAAKTYDINFNQPVSLAGKQLSAGDYRLDLAGDKVVLTNGKQSVEGQAKIEQSEIKFRTTTVRLSNAEGKMIVREIDLGGTKTKLVFND